MKRVCVYCGSSPGRQHDYVDAAKALGQEIVLIVVAARIGSHDGAKAVLEKGVQTAHKQAKELADLGHEMIG